MSRWTDINTIAHNIAVQVESGNWLYSLVGIGMVVAMLFAVWFVSYSDGAERRIPVQYAARKYNARGQASYIPVKLLMSGVMPIIFAGVIMSIPATVDMFVDATKHVRLHSVLSVFSSGSWIYYAVYVILIALSISSISRFSLMLFRFPATCAIKAAQCPDIGPVLRQPRC